MPKKRSTPGGQLAHAREDPLYEQVKKLKDQRKQSRQAQPKSKRYDHSFFFEGKNR